MNDQGGRLRGAAGLLRGYADDLNEIIDATIERYPPSVELWDGPAADRFYDGREANRRNISFLADALRDHADTLDSRAEFYDENPGMN